MTNKSRIKYQSKRRLFEKNMRNKSVPKTSSATWLRKKTKQMKCMEKKQKQM